MGCNDFGPASVSASADPEAREITSSTIKILLADDDVVFCRALQKWAATEPTLDIVGEAHDGQEAVSMAEELKPNVILMDVEMPVINGIDATRKIVAKDPDIRIIAHSLHSYKQIKEEMYDAGASAYVLKEDAVDDLLGVIRRVTSSGKL